jgi:hypothetical protein
MSQNQLTIIDPPNRELLESSSPESTIVERFTEASRDIVPSVEISLAKRIIRAGSNQVLCLAAHTSVPLNEDEVASVSDLAVRLSDGTNVRLSLSFFNDQGVGCIPVSSPQLIPMNRSIYDPNRYELRGEPKLGLVLFATSIIALAGLYSVLNGPFSPFKWQTAFQSVTAAGKTANKTIAASVHPAMLKAKPAKVDSESAKSVSKDDSNPSPRNVGGGESKSPTARARVAKAHQTRAEHMFIPPPPNTPSLAHMKNMFVPPPPPMTYSISPESALLPFDPLQGLAPVSAKTSHSVTTKSAPKTRPVANDESGLDQQSTGNTKSALNAKSTQIAEPTTPPRSASEPLSGSRLSEPQLERIPAGAGDNNGATAPVPGEDGYPALERIVMPN